MDKIETNRMQVGMNDNGEPTITMRDENKTVRNVSQIDNGNPSISLINKQGRIALGMQLTPEQEPILSLHDQAAIPKASLAIISTSPQLWLKGDAPKSGAVLRVEKGGEPNLRLYGNTGRPQAVMTVTRETMPGFYLFDENGKLRTALSQQPGQGPGLVLHNANGQIGARIKADQQLGSSVMLCDQAGNPRALLESDLAGDSDLVMVDQQRQIRLVAGFKEGRAGFGVFDPGGNKQWSAPEGGGPGRPSLPAARGLDLDSLTRDLLR